MEHTGPAGAAPTGGTLEEPLPTHWIPVYVMPCGERYLRSD